MILRPYQEAAIKDASDALDKHNNTLVVAPTGAGKTIMLSALVGKRSEKNQSILVLQHRDELVSQNMGKFALVNPNISTSVVNAARKDWNGKVSFAMVQTLSRENNLSDMPKLDMIVVDEAHHVIADTYQRIINAAKKANQKIEVVGFTATPNRGDKKGLRDIFTNCSHQIEIGTLIREGFLVQPRTFVVDVGVQDDLRTVRKTITDFDMTEVEGIMNRRAVNKRVVEEWMEKAGDRKTIVFCSTIQHAQDLCEEFKLAGVSAETVTGDTPKDDREEILDGLSHGDIQVVVNVAVLTEGFDAPPVSCVVLTRPCSYKATMVQMIGRGLRTINPEEFPGVVKTDCIVMDFGTSVLTHGSLDDSVNLDGSQADPNEENEAPTKECPNCKAEVPLSVRECPFCDHIFEGQDADPLQSFVMTEIELIDKSPFRWIDLFGTGKVLAASGFEGFAMVVDTNDFSMGIVKRKNGRARLVSIGTRSQAIAAADDFLREVEDSTAANKSKRWLNQPVTPKQMEHLNRNGFEVNAFSFNWTKYKAACMLNYAFNKRQIDSVVNHCLTGK